MNLPDDGSILARRAGYPPAPESLPTGVIEHGRYRVRFAASAAEVDEALRLRFQVFNLEMGEGLESSMLTGRDVDPFDGHCHHLLVEHDGVVVGTYRMQTAAMAEAGLGFYSAGEFDLSTLPLEVMGQSFEVGRACIAREHRNRQVLLLLWKGLARYQVTNGKRYLFGCSSLSTQDPVEGLRVLRFLEGRGRLHAEIRISPQPGFECVLPELAEGAPADEVVELPSLFRTYMRYGAWICGPPAIDREFKTIDFFVLFDADNLDARRRQLFYDS
jgi:putative hemolysin